MENLKIIDKKKLGLLHGHIHLLKVNFSFDSKRENIFQHNTKEEYLKCILDIDKQIKELYYPKN